MKFSLNCDTSNMTKEERLALRSQLQAALSQLNHELNTASKAQHLYFTPSEPQKPCSESKASVRFLNEIPDLTKLPDTDLEALRKENRELLSQIMYHIHLRKMIGK